MNTALFFYQFHILPNTGAHFSKVPIIILQALFFYFQLGAFFHWAVYVCFMFPVIQGFNSFETKTTSIKPSVNETC